MIFPVLPITEFLPMLTDELRQNGIAVLEAPPGAGKTTLVPLAIDAAGPSNGKILMLEPRRIATRAAAERMADLLGQTVGDRVGYRMRGDTKTGPQTKIEVVTEGILTRMLQTDPELQGYGTVIFDEFHERSLNADLGLALTVETRNALRSDLNILVMSATLDTAPIAEMLECRTISAQGRSFPVETHWLDRPLAQNTRLEQSLADLVITAIGETSGGVLVFLPGEGEIRRLASILQPKLPADCQLQPLFGAMDFRDQKAAIAPVQSGRKVVLATAIAETSLTIADVSTVVDAGLARRSRFDAGSGMSRLITERASKAEADQRRGRAGRTLAGDCYRLWSKGEEGGMPPFAPPEISTSDLSSLALELAEWGVQSCADMAFLTQPNPGALAAARALLSELDAIDQSGSLTKYGRQILRIPLHPRLAHMVLKGGRSAPMLAALLADRDPLRGAWVDLLLRKEALEGSDAGDANRATLQRVRAEAKRLGRFQKGAEDLSWAELAALAYPDRIGLRRPGSAPRWILSGGKEAVMGPHDPMAGTELIVVADLDGHARQAKIRLAITITKPEIRRLFSDKIKWTNLCSWSRRDARVQTLQRETLGALVLQERAWKNAPAEEVAAAVLEGIRDLGLPMTPAVRRFCARVHMVRQGGQDLPDMSEPALMERLEEWLLPHLKGVRSKADIAALKLLEPLQASLDWQQTQVLRSHAPSHYITPMDRKIAIDYDKQDPEISVRIQEMFGVTTHPVIAGRNLRINLLSPAHRPLQTTADLPGFWKTSYSDVRKEMRGRYPKHPWPEDPGAAAPTLRAKPRSR